MGTIRSLPPYTLFLLLLWWATALSDPDPLQDYCVAVGGPSQPFFFNGVPCVNPNAAVSAHFMSSILSKAGDTNGNYFGFNVTLTDTRNFPGCNTQGLTMARVDIAGGGAVPLHSHPRASEVTILLKGSLVVGFVDTTNRLFFQKLQPGDSFVFPRGTLHFLLNLDSSKPAFAISGLNSQNPGAQISSLASFVSRPPIPDEILKKSFRISGQDVERIRRNLGG
ncbi:germin-like protein subfamily 1 member 1 [Aristolochia californica]|uniref:germin-like protein subfamily 1 member 1 n=1 Tax=Aristolochia californica TaxID=171875 RepID=UPI0035E2DF47